MSTNTTTYVGFITGSNPDSCGNSYWAMEVIRTADGKRACGIVSGGEANCTAALYALAGSDHYVHQTRRIGYREFKRLTANADHLGCGAEEIIAALTKAWDY